jgi:hypothetical protein
VGESFAERSAKLLRRRTSLSCDREQSRYINYWLCWKNYDRNFAPLLGGKSIEVFSAKLKQGAKNNLRQDSNALTVGAHWVP